jgi:hypothetical protein
MGKRTTPLALDDRSMMINRRSADNTAAMLGTVLSIPRPVRVAAAGPIDAQVEPELPVSRSVRLRATWRKVEGGGLVCHWTPDLE